MFDLGKHLARKHVRTLHGYVEICFRAIKQDPLCKRPAAVAGEAWRAIGGCTGLLNVHRWLSIYDGLMGFTTPFNECSSPFFIDDLGRELTYPKANTLLRKLLLRVSDFTEDQARLYSVGGVRSLGYNAAKGVDGDELARVQGMWGSDAHMHYDRPMLERVLALPSRLAQYASAATAPISPVGAFEASSQNFLVTTTSSGSSSTNLPIVSKNSLPVGWSTHMHQPATGGRPYRVYVHVDGRRALSLPAMRRLHAASSTPPSSPARALPQLAAQPSPGFRLHPLTQPQFLHEIVVEGDRPSKRRPPARRA